ncbi:MAG: penicillin-binding protein 2 [Alphaproteobacteria bacterium]|uniref:Beta-lactamase n=1 Tax=Candidatus Nitrobium versatile TaxID=2884831 RepID=A0A953J650_9BACT|nr:penicillin-binding protein 2 [Candidatus Nitrobium versatile]
MVLKRIQAGSYIIVTVLLLIGIKLVQLQIFDGDQYRMLSEKNRLRILKTPAPRGIIYDRNGTPLVKNIPVFSVSISLDDLKGIDIDSLSLLLGMTRQEIEERVNRRENSPFIPVKLKQGLNFEEIAHIEARKSDFPGLFVETEVGREYLFGKTGAHIIGYLGKITTAQMDKPDLKYFPPDALIGQWGVEALYDSRLRGTPGERVIEVDALGRELRLIQQRPSVKGSDVTLSIDINIQKAVEDAFGEKAGALVAIKPGTGEILALESLPSFDPNVFSRGIKYQDWKELMEDKKKPMLNRALQSQYPPGSTFKIVTAIAALEESAIEPERRINCSGGISYGKWSFGCWKKGGHGSVDLHKSLVESCDTYYYEVGRRIGIDKIHKYATMLGLGKETGLNLLIRERKGLIPSTGWKRERLKQQWYLGETYNASIGQGYVTTTPIQMAKMMATVANGGYLYDLTLVKGSADKPEGKVELKPETLRLVKSALAGVVNEPGGTAYSSRSPMVAIGGKTGTAQVIGKKKVSGERFEDHAWFVAFAPVDVPEIALAVFVENGGHGGSAAAPVAKKAIEAYFEPRLAPPLPRNPGERAGTAAVSAGAVSVPVPAGKEPINKEPARTGQGGAGNAAD